MAMDMLKESTEKRVSELSLNGNEFFQGLLEEAGEDRCTKDASRILEEIDRQSDPKIVRCVAKALKRERQTKFDLHIQWKKLFGRGRDN